MRGRRKTKLSQGSLALLAPRACETAIAAAANSPCAARKQPPLSTFLAFFPGRRAAHLGYR